MSPPIISGCRSGMRLRHTRRAQVQAPAFPAATGKNGVRYGKRQRGTSRKEERAFKRERAFKKKSGPNRC